MLVAGWFHLVEPLHASIRHNLHYAKTWNLRFGQRQGTGSQRAKTRNARESAQIPPQFFIDAKCRRLR